MRINYNEITLTIDRTEALDLYLSLKLGIEASIDTHWKYHPDSFDSKEHKLYLLKKLCPYVDRDFTDLYSEFKTRLKGTPQ